MNPRQSQHQHRPQASCEVTGSREALRRATLLKLFPTDNEALLTAPGIPSSTLRQI